MSKPKAIWRRVGDAMFPDNEDARRALSSLKDGGCYLGEFHGARSLKQLRLFWGLMAMLVEHEIFPARQAACDAVKIATGHVDTYIMPDTGEAFLIPKSIAFESLKQAEFTEFMDAAIKVIVRRWLPGAEEDLRQEFFDALEDPARGPGRRVWG